MFLVKNLNIIELDKNFAKEFESPSLNTSVETLLNQIATSLNLNPSKIGII